MPVSVGKSGEAVSSLSVERRFDTGSDADIVVWNPETEWTMTAENQQSACDYCPMEGTKIRGRAEQVYLRGRLVAENGKIIEENTGVYVHHGAE